MAISEKVRFKHLKDDSLLIRVTDNCLIITTKKTDEQNYSSVAEKVFTYEDIVIKDERTITNVIVDSRSKKDITSNLKYLIDPCKSSFLELNDYSDLLIISK